MIPEPINAYIAELQRELAEIKAYLTQQNPAWNTKIASQPASGASGTMTSADQSLDGYVTPVTSYGANIREWSSTADDNPPLYQLAYGDHLPVTAWASDMKGNINPKTGKPYVWYMVADGEDNFVREDVVTFTADKPVIPINAALWPAPVTGYTVTNTHGEHAHDGIDMACPMGTTVRCGPNGGEVAKIFECDTCNPYGDGINSLNDPDKGWGYGSYVIVRYPYTILPQTIKSLIPQDAYLFAMHAHLSMIPTVLKKGMILDPYQKIGEVGSTGNSSGPHLHYALHWAMSAAADFYGIRENAIDPKLLIQVKS